MKKNKRLSPLLLILFFSTIHGINVSSFCFEATKKSAGILMGGVASIATLDALHGHTESLPMNILIPSSFLTSYHLLKSSRQNKQTTPSMSENIANIFGVFACSF